MKWIGALTAFLMLTACGVGGPPATPGSEDDPRVMEIDQDFFT